MHLMIDPRTSARLPLVTMDSKLYSCSRGRMCERLAAISERLKAGGATAAWSWGEGAETALAKRATRSSKLTLSSDSITNKMCWSSESLWLGFEAVAGSASCASAAISCQAVLPPLAETRAYMATFEPPQRVRDVAHVRSLERYQEMYERSIQHPASPPAHACLHRSVLKRTLLAQSLHSHATRRNFGRISPAPSTGTRPGTSFTLKTLTAPRARSKFAGLQVQRPTSASTLSTAMCSAATATASPSSGPNHAPQPSLPLPQRFPHR
jgi:hypothetical protein